jgi:NAD(P)-dependent dehydrogenase (short-subunit alcohol dehydrogenase family)
MTMKKKNNSRFNLENKTALITGGGGFLGPEHAIGLARYSARIILIDIDKKGLKRAQKTVLRQIPDAHVSTAVIDISNENSIKTFSNKLEKDGVDISILVNNAAINPKMGTLNSKPSGLVEDYDIEELKKELDVGIIGTFLCCKIFGSKMANMSGGTIINIASDLAIKAPDQRVYSKTNRIQDVVHFKPIGYPIVKSAMLGLNRYLATYWAHKDVRVNCLIPGAVLNNQSEQLINQIKQRVPLHRLAEKHEYQEMIVFLASDASSYMTGGEIIMDGGRSIW